jgi:hypothetical protein
MGNKTGQCLYLVDEPDIRHYGIMYRVRYLISILEIGGISSCFPRYWFAPVPLPVQQSC